MRSRYAIQILLTLVLIAGVFAALYSSNGPQKETRCKESMDACCEKSSSDKMIWENLPRQFFSSF